MSIEKNMNTRIQHKHDIEANWNKALNFIPKIGEIIVYDIDDNCNYSRFKIGDGVRTINDLEFLLDTQYILHNSNTLSQILEQYRSDIENITFEETDPTVPSWAKASAKPSYTKNEVGLGNVDNVKQYSASNPPPYPITSVNGKTGAVTVDVPTNVSQLTNDKGYLTKHQDISGKLDKTELPTAINTALAQAKASGEFNGKDGKDGYTPIKGVDYFDGQPGKDGADGKDGAIPLKFLQGKEFSKLLEKDENNNYIVPLNAGTIYFVADGKIVWDCPTTATSTERIVMGKPEIITKTTDTIITLNNSSWTDITPLNKSEFADTIEEQFGGGTFALQIYIMNATDTINNVKQSNTYYSGTVSWYWGGTGQSDAISSDEILLHRSGMLMQNIHLYARIYKPAPGTSILQLKSNTNVSIDANNLTVKLRRLI